jgi:hypothetical protein
MFIPCKGVCLVCESYRILAVESAAGRQVGKAYFPTAVLVLYILSLLLPSCGITSLGFHQSFAFFFALRVMGLVRSRIGRSIH